MATRPIGRPMSSDLVAPLEAALKVSFGAVNVQL